MTESILVSFKYFYGKRTLWIWLEVKRFQFMIQCVQGAVMQVQVIEITIKVKRSYRAIICITCIYKFEPGFQRTCE